MKRKSTTAAISRRPALESLESRRLLSAAAIDPVAHPLLSLSPDASASSFTGYTPAQIRHAYGFDQVAGNGAGQTIAIVDAYNDPNIAADLKVFDQQYGLADPPSFKAVSQTGAAASTVKTDTGWSGEIALDVEWAHAIAPGANILLVEAKSSTISDLMAGVDYARKAAGVSVVSMSWGGSEFLGQTQYDKYFTTPTGHTNVTFVASSGDSGSWFGPSWPATSPNVLSVGGTSLYTSDASGTYSGESGWRYSGGGISTVYTVPAYQAAAQSTGFRTNPDVAYNADPNTGFAVYDSLADQGYVGWQVIGGTSAGAPQWAALIAIADQQRVAAGNTTLDGAAATLPTLYKLYAAPGSASYSTYTANFNDVSTGRTSRFLAAHAGYDGVTGLGSPKVAQVVSALTGADSPGVTSTKSAKAAATRKNNTKRFPVTDSGSDSDEATATTVTPSDLIDLRPTAALATGSTARELASATPLLGGTRSILTAAASGHLLSIGNIPAAIVSASPLQAVASAVSPQLLGTLLDVGAPALSAAAPAAAASLLPFASTDAATAFSDALASFAHDSASIGGAMASGVADAASSHSRAWAVTFGVLTVDAILIGTWQSQRRASLQAKRRAQSSTFGLVPVSR